MVRPGAFSLVTIGFIGAAFACSSKSSTSASSASATASPASAPSATAHASGPKPARSSNAEPPPSASASAAATATATGALLRGPLLDGYESIGASDPDAKEAVDSGGIFLRQKGNPAGFVIGASALPGLPVDPADSEICAAASAANAKNSATTLSSAQVVTVGGKSVCRAELARPDTKLVSRSFSWLLDPSAKLGVMVVCVLDPADAATEQACVTFVSGVIPARRG